MGGRPKARYDAAGNKQCSVCQRFLSLDGFHCVTKSWDKRALLCRSCGKAKSKNYYRHQGASTRLAYRLKQVGKDRAWYEDRLMQQDYRCAICLRSFVLGRQRSSEKPCIDHDHQTGVARGLLCGHCNRAIGSLGESVENFARAIAYLKKFSCLADKEDGASLGEILPEDASVAHLLN